MGGIPYFKHVQSLGVAEIPAADFGAHVPSVEGSCGELYASAVEHHAGDGGKGVPSQVEFLEPVVAEKSGTRT